MARTFQKFLQSKIDLSSVGLEFVKIMHHTFVRPKDHLYLVGQVWTVSISALFGALEAWYFPLTL